MKKILIISLLFCFSLPVVALGPSEADIKMALKHQDVGNKLNREIRKTGACKANAEKQGVVICPINITYKRKAGDDQSYSWKSAFKQVNGVWEVSNQ